MRCLELFAGGGGAACGLERAGFEHVALVEWDAAACATLRAAGFSGVLQADLRRLNRRDAWARLWERMGRRHKVPSGLRHLRGRVDALWASPPCQPWSQAGSRRGAQDERNGWPWTFEAIDTVQPRWVMLENVGGSVAHAKKACGDPERCAGCYFERVILVKLRERFRWVGWWLLDAADFGVPQHRRRVFIVAGPQPVACPRRTHGPAAVESQASLFGSRLRPWRTMGQALGIAADSRVDLQEGAGRARRRGARAVRLVGDGPAPTVRARSKGAAPMAVIGRASVVIGGGRNPQHRGAPRGYRDLTGEPSVTMTAVQVGNRGPFVVSAGVAGQGRPRSMGEPAPSVWAKGTAYLCRPAPTVTKQEVKGTRACAGRGWAFNGGPDRASDALWAAVGRRRLTVGECARLQGFPWLWPFVGTKTERYAQVGNAVAPRHAQVVGGAVMRAARRAADGAA